MAGMKDEKKTHSARTFAWFALPTLAILLLWSFLPSGSSISHRSPRTAALNQIKQILIACRAYAADHEGGLYPPLLDALYPDYIDDERLFYALDKQGNRIPIIYHPGFKDTDDPRPLLIEHPIHFGTKRIVGYVGGHIEEIQAP